MPQIKEILDKALQKDLYEALIKQLNKDFLLANIDLGFHPEIPSTSLKLLLVDAVENLVETDRNQLQNLLYVVDVSEEKIATINFKDTQHYAVKTTELVIERIWKKVCYRAKYS